MYPRSLQFTSACGHSTSARYTTSMLRRQFTLRALLLAVLVEAAFFGGIRFERELQRRRDRALLDEVEGAEERSITLWSELPA